MTYFVARLLPPRPSFLRDMTAEEAGLMAQHGAYLSGLAQDGVAILFGPVDDPKGAWGLAVFRVADEAAVRAITERDPVIVARQGFSYEILPMLQAGLSPAAFATAPAA